MSSSATLRRLLVAGSVLTAVGMAVGAPAAAAATPTYYGFSGLGYGSTAHLGTVVSSGPTSEVSMCTLKDISRTNTAAATNLGAAGTVGAVQSSTTGLTQSTTKTATTTTTTAGFKLLTGIIQGQAVTSQAVMTHTTAGYAGTASAKFTALKIAGVSVTSAPAKNTTISLPNKLGSVILNHQTPSVKYGMHQITVNALDITVNAGNVLGLPAGRIIVGHSAAYLHDPVHARPFGSAYVTRVNVANGTVTSGPTAVSGLPCVGSSGATVSNTTAKVSIPNIATVGAAGTTAASTDDSTATTARTSATVADVSLLGGIVKADAVTVKASATKPSDAALSTSSSGTAITGLTIKGQAVTVGTSENGKIDIAGVGTLWLHRTSRSSTAIQVYGIQLELLNATAGLSAGTTITIGSANAGVAAQ